MFIVSLRSKPWETNIWIFALNPQVPQNLFGVVAKQGGESLGPRGTRLLPYYLGVLAFNPRSSLSPNPVSVSSQL